MMSFSTLFGCSSTVGVDVKHNLPPVREVIPDNPPDVKIQKGDDARIDLLKVVGSNKRYKNNLNTARENYTTIYNTLQK